MLPCRLHKTPQFFAAILLLSRSIFSIQNRNQTGHCDHFDDTQTPLTVNTTPLLNLRHDLHINTIIRLKSSIIERFKAEQFVGFYSPNLTGATTNPPVVCYIYLGIAIYIITNIQIFSESHAVNIESLQISV